MKFSAVFFLLLTALESNVATAANDTIFVCSLNDGKQISVEHDASDMFTLTYGKDLERPEVMVQKTGNDLGTSYYHSQAEGTSSRELYVIVKDLMFTIGADDQSGARTGYLQISQVSGQKSHLDCINGTMLNKFDDFDLFVNLTEVD